MHKLYDLGYQTIKDPDILAQVAEKLGATVLDIRFSPRSRDYRWNKAALATIMSGRYTHVAELGNVNYKDWSAPIQISHLDYGMRLIWVTLEANPVILLCACRDRKTCHRLVVVEATIRRYSGIVSVPLGLSDCLEIINPEGAPSAQLKLF